MKTLRLFTCQTESFLYPVGVSEIKQPRQKQV